MADHFDDDEDIGESVLPTDVQERAVPMPLTKIQPWHHPRKQYVRERQWQLYTRQFINRMIERNGLDSGKVKYLTLPGIDYFDVEAIGDVTSELGLSLQAIGFLAEAEREPIKARSQFRAESLIKRGLMEDTSITFSYRFEDLATPTSQASAEVKSRAPFHVVNIDACGSIAPPTADHASRIIDAIHGLIGIQFTAARDSWVLFVTSDARTDNLSEKVLNALKEAIRSNAQASDEFANGALAALSTAGALTIEDALDEAHGQPKQFSSMFSLGLSKWILHLADAEGWDVKSRQFYCYSTSSAANDDPTMCCLAFEFVPRPVFPADQFGAINSEPPPVENQTDYSMQALKRATEMENLDEFLEANTHIKADYLAEQRQRLVDAGYQAAALTEFDDKFS